MRNQYPHEPENYQCSEPRDYLVTFEGIRQISLEKLEIIKAKFRNEKQPSDKDQPSLLEKEDEDGLSSFFYAQGFGSSNKE